MKKIAYSLFVIVFLICSCNPTNKTINESEFTIPISTDINPTPTEQPKVTTIVDSFMFYNPTSKNYHELVEIPVGTKLTPLGKFGEFIKIEYLNSIGYVPSVKLSELTMKVPEISRAEIEPLKINLIDYVYEINSFKENGKLIIDNMDSDQYAGNDIGPFDISEPVSIDLQFSSEGQTQGVVILSGKLPGLHWWENRNSMLINGNGRIDFYNGQSENSYYSIELPQIAGQRIYIQAQDIFGKIILIKDDKGKIVATLDIPYLSGGLLKNGLFPDNVFFFQTVATPHSKLMVHKFDLLLIPDGIYQPETPTLRELADEKGKLLGTVVDYGPMIFNSKYQDLIKDNFNGATITFHWSQIEPEKGVFDFSAVDVAVDFAIQNNMKITGLHLIYGWTELMPDWLVNGNHSKEELKKILFEYINTVVSHYKGKIYIWSIANESIGNMICCGGDFWYKKLGEEYIESSFKWAHEADPNALLMLNECDNQSIEHEYNKLNVEQMIDFITTWRIDGTPIDVVGTQMHVLSPWSNNVIPTKEDFTETLNLFIDNGMPVYITEFDVNLNAYPGDQETRWEYQGTIYRNILETCLEIQECKGFSLFGLSDYLTWYDYLQIPNAEPLPFDVNFQPKPAYYAMFDVLSK